MQDRLDQLDAELREAEEALADLESHFGHNQQQRHSSRSPRRSGQAALPGRLERQQRPASTLPSSDERAALKLVVRLAFEETGRLGLAFKRGKSGAGIVVADILDDSPAMDWNLHQRERRSPELALRVGDKVVEVNGVWVHSASDLERGLASRVGQHVQMQLLRPASLDQSPRRGAPSPPPSATDRMVPGRCCRAVGVPAAVPPTVRTALDTGLPFNTTSAPGGCKRSTFGSEQRFPPPLQADETGPQLLPVSDRFLSTKPSQMSAVIAPLPLDDHGHKKVKKKGEKIAKSSRHANAATYARGPGLRGVQSSLVSLIRAEADDAADSDEDDLASDDVSTQAGSDLLDASSLWSSSSQEAWPSLPGPGDYEPNYGAVTMSKSKGVPCFGRYLAREPPRRSSALSKKVSEGEGTEGVAESSSLAGSTATSSVDSSSSGATRLQQPRRRGGVITPLPSHAPRRATNSSSEALLASRRPFYEAAESQKALDPVQPVVNLSLGPETGRLKELQPIDEVGPGAYELKALVPGDVPTALLGPGFGAGKIGGGQSDSGEACAGSGEQTGGTGARQAELGPGPADYDALDALIATCPRAPAAFLGRLPPQPHPQPADAQSALSPRWEVLRPRAPAASINVPTFDPRLLPPMRSPGPGAYKVDNDATKRIREGMHVRHWFQPAWQNEHEHALYNPRPVDRSIRGDPRPLLDPRADTLTFRRKFRAFMRYQSEPPAPVDRRWRFYNAAGTPEPLGLADFAHRVSFEEFREWNNIRERLQELHHHQMRPSLRLAQYSLPELDVTKVQAPRPPNFDKVLARQRGDEDFSDSPREGDVLLLSLHAEKDLFHPRVVAGVDMSRQLGRRSRSAPPDLGEESEGDELALSPRPVRRRTPMFVDMSKVSNSPADDFTFSANVWANDNGLIYTFKPTSAMSNGKADEALLLDADRGARYLQPSLGHADFALPLGREEHDPRVPTRDIDSLEAEQELLLHWRPRPPAPTPPTHLGPAPAATSATVAVDAAPAIGAAAEQEHEVPAMPPVPAAAPAALPQISAAAAPPPAAAPPTVASLPTAAGVASAAASGCALPSSAGGEAASAEHAAAATAADGS
mmetsp:Transcript_9211/g.20541  ORF Transcript_9211/g.20541 Transcript_9211/m.20541 type:complete len:1097 (-) Transcript_9211:34-3324(-)